MSTILFHLLIFLLPAQLGKHFWFDFSYINGLRIDYLSPTIYLTDIIIILLFISVMLNFYHSVILNLFQDPNGIPKQVRNDKLSVQDDKNKKPLVTIRVHVFLLSVFCYLFSVSFFAVNPTVSFLQFFRILEMIFLGFYLSQNLGKSIKMSTVVFLLSLSVFYESLLAIWQFIKQGSVGGWWWFLGERTFNSATPFISQAVINGQLLLRSYGTFPHPNVLGGYLAVVLPLLTYFVWDKKQKLPKKVFLIITIVCGLIALFLSFSRTAWIVVSTALLLMFIVRAQRELKRLNFSRSLPRAQSMGSKNPFFTHWYLLAIGLLVIISTYLLLGNSLVSRFQTLEDVDKKSLIIREQLNAAAVKIVSEHPIFGVGLNNFLISLPRYYQTIGVVRFFQPAHNIYLEIAAETGLVGFIIFIIFITSIIRRLLKNHSYLMLLLLFEIIILGFFDHYFYTLQQGQLLLTLVLGLAWSSSLRHSASSAK